MCLNRQKNRYTKEDIGFLEEHYPKGDFESIFRRFPSVTKQGIISICHSHGISADYFNNKKWTDDDLEVVEKYYYEKSLDEIREMIGNRHTCDAIQTKALRKFGYSKDMSWTNDEIDILKTYYLIEYVDDVCKRLPNRTRGAIIREANVLGIWKTESMKACAYKCVLTGSKDFKIHHLYSFSAIFDEVLEDTGFVLKDRFEDYSDDELSFILNKFMAKHEEYPLGVCVRTDIHDLFHNINGARVTPEMWSRFVDDYKNGTLKTS